MTVSAPTPTARAATPPHDQRAVLRGLGLVVVAVFLLPAQDSVAKFLSSDISPGQITWVRLLLQSLLTLPVLVAVQGWRGIVPNRLWPNVLRGALMALASMFYFIALKFMPLADALAILFIQPFILTILAAVVEKEHVGWRRSLAVAAGFVGVLIVVQPSWDVFGPVSLVPAAGGTLFAVYILLNRRMSRFDTPLTMQFTSGLAGVLVLTLVLAAGGLGGVPEMMPSAFGWHEAGLLLLMGIFGTGGHLLLVYAGRLAPSSLIAPMQYVEIVFAVIFGYLVFGDFPSPVKWLGIAIIVGSGAYVFWRENRLRGNG